MLHNSTYKVNLHYHESVEHSYSGQLYQTVKIMGARIIVFMIGGGRGVYFWLARIHAPIWSTHHIAGNIEFGSKSP